MSENNLLATGQVTAGDVKRLVSRCSGEQYVARPMTDDPQTLKHEMKPVAVGEQWFIRFYFVAVRTEMVMFISVHKIRYRR